MSPPAWGWPATRTATLQVEIDVPTRVGMARRDPEQRHPRHGCPHPRGDGPLNFSMFSLITSMSPPAWGWPVGTWFVLAPLTDVPTRVGMARHASRSRGRNE